MQFPELSDEVDDENVGLEEFVEMRKIRVYQMKKIWK